MSAREPIPFDYMIDTQCHLDTKQLENDIEQVI